MNNENFFDDLIKRHAGKYHLPWLLIKTQIWQESRFNANAVSPCGAKGLMQLMPGTATELLGEKANLKMGPSDGGQNGEINLFDPDLNIQLGVRYDRIQYDHFPEIPNTDERMKFMLAAYNCGRGYVNQALRLARVAEFGFQPKVLAYGQWMAWEYSHAFLSVPACQVNGKRPDYEQVRDYVEKIWEKYQQYLATEGGDHA